MSAEPMDVTFKTKPERKPSLLNRFFNFKKVWKYSKSGSKGFVDDFIMEDILQLIQEIFFLWGNMDEMQAEPNNDNKKAHEEAQKNRQKDLIIKATLKLGELVKKIKGQEIKLQVNQSSKTQTQTMTPTSTPMETQTQSQTSQIVHNPFMMRLTQFLSSDHVVSENQLWVLKMDANPKHIMNRWDEQFAKEAQEKLKNVSTTLFSEDVEDARKFFYNFINLIASYDTPVVLKTLSQSLKNERDQGNIPNCNSPKDLEENALLLEALKASKNISKILDQKILYNKEIMNAMRNKRIPLSTSGSSSILELDVVVDYIIQASNNIGIELTRNILVAALNNPNLDLNYILSLLEIAAQIVDEKGSASKTKQEEAFLLNLIAKDPINKDTWADFKDKLIPILLQAHQRKYPERPLEEVMKDFATKSLDVVIPLSAEELKSLNEQYVEIKKLQEELLKCDNTELTRREQACKAELQKSSNMLQNKLHLLAIIRERIKRAFGVYPTNVQMLNVLALLNDPKGKRLAQIKTGEGKSITIAILAAFKAFTNKVDIATTSSDLAKRDAEKFKLFYQSMGLTVDCLQERSTAFSTKALRADVLYGPTAEFEFVHLFDGLGEHGISRKHRPYKVMIVDEVDSMFLDTQDSPAYIASKIESFTPEVYKKVWEFMEREEKKEGAKKNDKMEVNDNMEINNQNQNEENEEKEDIVQALRKYLKDLAKKIPDHKLEDWIESCRDAKHRFQENKQYIVKEGKIVIVDYQHTGSLMQGRTWHDGLHQFIGLKHNLDIEPENGTSGQMTHHQFFNLYEELYGLTGTLGDEIDLKELVELYNISYYFSPTYHKSQRKCDGHLLLNGRAARNEAIVKDVMEKTSNGRPVLIICETIAESEEIQKLLSDKCNKLQIYNGKQEDGTVELMLTLAGTAGTCTIATNTAGRGADISITKESESKGGLHAIITFPTINSRVETQGFGRPARQGKPGTFRYILDSTLLQKAVAPNNPNTLGELFIAWQKIRQKHCRINSLRIRQKNKVRDYQFLAQNLFYSLDKWCVRRNKDKWTELFTDFNREINQIIEEIYENFDRESKDLPSFLDDKARHETFKFIMKLWNEAKIATERRYVPYYHKSSNEMDETQKVEGTCGNPLLYAIKSQQYDCAALLLEFAPEAWLIEKDNAGKTALDLIERENLKTLQNVFANRKESVIFEDEITFESNNKSEAGTQPISMDVEILKNADSLKGEKSGNTPTIIFSIHNAASKAGLGENVNKNPAKRPFESTGIKTSEEEMREGAMDSGEEIDKTDSSSNPHKKQKKSG